MIYEIKRKYADIEGYEGKTLFSGDKIYINTQKIVTIEKYSDDGYEHSIKKEIKNLRAACIGLLINGIKYPLALIRDWEDDDEVFYKMTNEADEWLDCIFAEIVEIMKRENC